MSCEIDNLLSNHLSCMERLSGFALLLLLVCLVCAVVVVELLLCLCLSPAPTSLCRCRSILVRRRRSLKVGGGGAVLAANNFLSKISEKISFYPQNFLMTFFSFLFFSHRKLLQNNCTASAACRQIIGGGTPINKGRRSRPQIVGGAAGTGL